MKRILLSIISVAVSIMASGQLRPPLQRGEEFRVSQAQIVLAYAEIEKANRAAKVRTQATFFFFARKALFEKAKALIEALRNGKVSGLAVEDGMDDRFELFELSLEVRLHLLRSALCAHQKTTFQ